MTDNEKLRPLGVPRDIVELAAKNAVYIPFLGWGKAAYDHFAWTSSRRYRDKVRQLAAAIDKIEKQAEADGKLIAEQTEMLSRLTAALAEKDEEIGRLRK